MRIWAELFSEVHIYSPDGGGPPRGNTASYGCPNIQWHPLPFTFAQGWLATGKRLAYMPRISLAIYRAIRKNTFILLRSPGYFGFVGAAVVRLLGRRSITKWAGENGPFEGEGWITKLDRWLQSIPNKKNPVLVYGPTRRSHQISFIPALMTDEEIADARQGSQKTVAPPWEILSVGRMVSEKGFDLAIRGLAELNRIHPEVDWRYTLIGDGVARKSLEELALASPVAKRIRFAGALPFDEVKRYYAKSHLVIMPGVKEGWPKVIAEAWVHGAVPVAAVGGIVPHIIPSDEAGITFHPDIASLAGVIADFLADPNRVKKVAENIHNCGKDLSLASFQRKLEGVLVEHCGLK
jgi:glycosyltransferase involved in cell wall biosynthesis